MDLIDLGTVISNENDKRGQDGLSIAPVGHCSICSSCADFSLTI